MYTGRERARLASLDGIPIVVRHQCSHWAIRQQSIWNREKGCSKSGSGSARRLRCLSQVPKYLPFRNDRAATQITWQRAGGISSRTTAVLLHMQSPVSTSPSRSSRSMLTAQGQSERLHVRGFRVHRIEIAVYTIWPSGAAQGMHSAIFGSANRHRRHVSQQLPNASIGTQSKFAIPTPTRHHFAFSFLDYHLPVGYRNR